MKDVHGVEGEVPYVFSYSDRYSVFDWGAMPDELPGKGEALATIADNLFRFLARPATWQEWKLPAELPEEFRESLARSSAFAKLARNGLQHHSRGLVGARLEALGPGARSNLLAVDPVRVLRPNNTSGLDFDYSVYATQPIDALIPLEVIFRFGAPEGSSFLGRAAADPTVLLDAGLKTMPEPGEWFDSPIVEFSTKLEPTDRALSRAEAARIAGLSAKELATLIDTTLLLALRLRDIVARFGAELWDGKFEFAFTAADNGSGRGVRLIDSIGPDELRILMGGAHLSKEALRKVYRESAWYRAVGEAKEIAGREGTKEWKAICRDRLGRTPPPLPEAARQTATELYPALANAFASATGAASVFAGVDSLTGLVPRLKGMPRV